KLESLDQYLGCIIANAMQEGNQVAIWRKPKSNFLQVLLDKSGITKRADLNLEELPTGFIVHPFEDQEDQKAFFLEADSYFKIDLNLSLVEQQEQLELNAPIRSSSENAQLIRQYFAKSLENQLSGNLNACSKKDFIALVENGKQAIREGKLNKIVPARLKKKQLSDKFDLVQSIISLTKSYPNAFINFFHIPDLGSWLGASPEILIQTKGNTFYTMSLAGTQKAKGDNPMKNAAWTQKEIEEQALVSRYIVDCFKKIRLREYDEQGPKTVIAGNLLHLRSDFFVDMQATNFPQLGSVMLKLLHPTSAVCGMPREKAFEFLREYEKLDRSLFAGFIGPVNVEEETSIFVNLRTARLTEKEALLYAGAGVTEDSIPEKEWEETEMKCEIIGKHLN
uniref:chorismate-binding protein n=1 Tax=Cecembia rubra TaxID=1485585 RepID=UPI0027148F45